VYVLTGNNYEYMTIIDEVDINDIKLRKKAYDKAYRKANLDKIKARNKAYYKANIDKIKVKNKAYDEAYYKANIDKKKAYRAANPDKIKANDKAYYKANPDKIKARHKAWRVANPDKTKAYRAANIDKIKARNNTRTKTNIQYKLSKALRSRLYKALQGNYKNGSAVRDLGCSIDELKMHLESKFQSGMSWDNWSFDGWHIDHIKPLASFDLSDRAQLLLACHYTNLQPLWAIDNLSKGDSIINA